MHESQITRLAMKESKNIQKILDSLINHLENSVDTNVHHALGVRISEPPLNYSPLEYFLASLKDELPNDFNQALFTKIYREAFYIGTTPKNRNHIAIICKGHTNTQNFPEYQLWIDLDKIATTLGQHYQIPASKPLFITKDDVTGIASTMGIDGKSIYSSVRSAVNSNWSPQKASSLLLLGTIYGSIASGFMLLLGMLAVASLIAISSTGVGLLFAGAAATAGIAAYCFFQQNKNKKLEANHDTKGALQSASTDNLKPISIETAFKNNVTEKDKHLKLDEQSSRLSLA